MLDQYLKGWDLVKSHPVELSEEKGNSILQNLEGEIIDEKEWELVDEIKSNSEYSDEDWANYLIKEKKSLFRRFADEITANPNGFSYLDSKNYKVRYKYAVGSTKQSSSSRAFCVNMMSLSRGGTVYRIERIDKAGREGVNQQLGHNGQPYDLFKFKGGVYCRHIWNRVLYRLKANTKPSDNLGSYKKTKTIPASYLKSPRGAAESIIAPVNMDNDGHYPGVK